MHWPLCQLCCAGCMLWLVNMYCELCFVIHSGAKRTHFFQIIVTFFIFSIKKYVNTKTTCNKCSFDYLHWSLNYIKLYLKDGVLLAIHTSGASPQSSASHLVTFLVAQLQFLLEWKLSDRREVSERRLLIWRNRKERNRRQIQKHAFFLRHPVFSCIELRVCLHLCGRFTLKAFTRMQHKVLSLKSDTSLCEDILNSNTKPWTGLHQIGLPWTRPCGATPRPALPNRHVIPVTSLWYYTA